MHPQQLSKKGDILQIIAGEDDHNIEWKQPQLKKLDLFQYLKNR